VNRLSPAVFRLLTLVALAAPVSACSTLQGAVAPAADANTVAEGTATRPLLTPQQAQNAEAQYHILVGEMAAAREQHAVAAQEFAAAVLLAPDAELAARATAYALSAGDLDLATKMAERWLELDPQSMDAREVLLRVALDGGDIVQATAQAEAMASGAAGDPADGYRQVALLLAQGGPSMAETALRVAINLAEAHPEEAAAQYALGIVALRFGQLPMAEKAARQAVSKDRQSIEYGLLLTGVLVREGKLDESDAVFEQLVAQSSGKRDDLRLSYTKLLLESNQREAAQRQLKRVLKESPENPDARYALAVLAFGDGDKDTARTLFKSLLKDPDRGKDSAYQLGVLAETDGNDDQALKYYETVTSGNQAVEAVVRRAVLLGKKGQIGEAQALLARTRVQFPPLTGKLVQAEGEILMDAGKPDLALKTYANALAAQPDSSELLYGRSIVYERLDRVPEAEADLRAVLEQQPDDASALNALGYLLTVHTTRYEEAESLIGRALAQMPNDYAVIDSMGWVKFKLGQTDVARQLLKRAYEQTQDPEVAAHYGELLWANGEHDAARAVWKSGLKQDPDHEVLVETMKRLDP